MTDSERIYIGNLKNVDRLAVLRAARAAIEDSYNKLVPVACEAGLGRSAYMCYLDKSMNYIDATILELSGDK